MAPPLRELHPTLATGEVSSCPGQRHTPLENRPHLRLHHGAHRCSGPAAAPAPRPLQDQDQPVFDQSEFPALGNATTHGRGGGLPNGDAAGGSLGSAGDLYVNTALQSKSGGGQMRSEFSIQDEADFPALGGSNQQQRSGEEGDGAQKVCGLHDPGRRWQCSTLRRE